MQAESKFDLIDIGCETGSFLYYMWNKYKNAELSGIDIMPELLNKVNDGIAERNIDTYLIDISDWDSVSVIKKQWKIGVMSGVLSIFDDYRTVLLNALSLIKKEGTLYVFGIFNPKNVDVLIKAKKSEEKEDVWESGWNCISQKSIQLFLEEHGYICEFVPFHLNIDIEENKDDPLRTFTIKMVDKENLIVNGIQLIHNFALCKIKREGFK